MGILDIVVGVSIGLTVFFLLAANIILPFFNTAYNVSVAGLSSSTTQGLLLLVFVLGLIGVGVKMMPKTKK